MSSEGWREVVVCLMLQCRYADRHLCDTAVGLATCLRAGRKTKKTQKCHRAAASSCRIREKFDIWDFLAILELGRHMER